MTIKEFAKYCNCTTQTLRYYDKIGLLKPVKVDLFTGYRHYEEEQALDFVKIKNLQQASFSLEEIRSLLSVASSSVIEAFEKKINEQISILQTLKKIQQSYKEEYMSTKLFVEETKKRIHDDMEAYDPTEEFGLDKERYRKIISNTCKLFEALNENTSEDPNNEDDNIETESEENDFNPENDPSYYCVYKKQGWKNVKDFFDEVLTLENGEYLFSFALNKEKQENVSFCNTILGLILDANPEKKLTLGCNVFHSKDGVNKFCLYKRK